MAARSSLLLLAALAMVAAHADGASVAAPAPAVDCSDALISLAGCLSYVQEGSTVATPEESCCSGLKDVVRKEVACLCQAFQGGQDYGVTLNMTKALQLPGACKVKTPPFSKCHISMPGVSGGSPAPAPAPSSGAPFFDGSPSPSTPSAGSPAGTGAGSGDSTTARSPSPSASAASSTFPASANVLLAAATVAATLLM